MGLKKRSILVLSIFIVLAFFLTATGSSALADGDNAPVKVYKVGDKVEAINVQSLDGKTVNLIKELKKPTIIQFMNTACSACKAELGSLVGLKDDLNGKFDIFSVSVDLGGAASVKRYEGKWHFGVDYFLDPSFAAAPVFGFSFTPAFVVLDKSGTILMSQKGFMISREQQVIDGIIAALK